MIYLLAQVLLSVALLVPMFSRFHWVSLTIGGIFFFFGVALYFFSLRALRLGTFHLTPRPKSDRPLIRTGPYSLIRHPMYAASLLVFLGVTIGYGDPIKILIFLALVVVLLLKARQEEVYLKKQFPEYAEYMRTTWRLLPFVF